MRFDDEFYLQDYKRGNFPKIHDRIFQLISSRMMGNSCVDLCGNSGLLGQRVIDILGEPCILIEGSQSAIDMATKYQTSIPKHQLVIKKGTYGVIDKLIRENKINVLIARRCISELFTSVTDPDRHDWANMLHAAGVREVFLQGRAVTVKATHPIPSVAEEIQCFPDRYKVVYQQGQLAYLKAID